MLTSLNDDVHEEDKMIVDRSDERERSSTRSRADPRTPTKAPKRKKKRLAPCAIAPFHMRRASHSFDRSPCPLTLT